MGQCGAGPKSDGEPAAAADAFKAGRISQVLITGHTDRSGSEIYNLRLSQVRAEAVRRAMESFGVDTQAMMARGVGEGQPKVPTEDGALSAQNRRAQIDLRAQ